MYNDIHSSGRTDQRASSSSSTFACLTLYTVSRVYIVVPHMIQLLVFDLILLLSACCCCWLAFPCIYARDRFKLCECIYVRIEPFAFDLSSTLQQKQRAWIPNSRAPYRKISHVYIVARGFFDWRVYLDVRFDVAANKFHQSEFASYERMSHDPRHAKYKVQ